MFFYPIEFISMNRVSSKRRQNQRSLRKLKYKSDQLVNEIAARANFLSIVVLILFL